MTNSQINEKTVIVIGAGVAGCHTALELATDHDVVILDRSGIAAGATGLSAGIVAPTLFYGDLPDVAHYTNDFFQKLDGTQEFDFIERDRLDFVAKADEDHERQRAAELAQNGFPVSYLEPHEVTKRYPQFNLESFVGAVHYGDTGWVDPYTYTTVLKALAEEKGAVFETGIEVENIVVEGGKVVGVDTNNGHYESSTVVVAAGWRTRELLPAEVNIPIRPYRTQCAILDPNESLESDFPLGRIRTEHLYFRPEENGDLLIGGSHHTVDDPTQSSSDADESFILEVADYVPELVDGFESAELVNGWAGIDTATPDTRPIIDAPIDAPDNLIIATGFNGMGIMASPIVGPIVRQRLTGENATFSTEAFDADRFGELGTEFEYVSTSDI
ncbi:NAD(P)/FAD-dependent oxidoreductase [Natronorubrum aibiense]|uniref:FAD-dependent oxidoreductase n=1 Tax=Natronorubrum aibiense TaxID=348826 RepID=A0A5P9P8U6_9EURY|nr:FAD-dependent oxidoreductase [Natronorubrum aibiense]QFU84534.1 FAD-dependent oxidoreductase [Natronorubrum aibiense]